jgi:hypothetical protein
MCRSIKVLRKPDEAATPDELRAAALQFVRKISGFHKPSRVNEEAFTHAVDEIAATSGRLLEAIAAKSSRKEQSHPSAASEQTYS